MNWDDLPGVGWADSLAKWIDAILGTGRGLSRKDVSDTLGRSAKMGGIWGSRIQRNMVGDLLYRLGRAKASGLTYQEFIAAERARMQQSWGNGGNRIAFTVGNATWEAFTKGRVAQAAAMATKLPMWEYSAILDGRTTRLCRGLDGTILPVGDPWWNSHTPPMHDNCRSSIVPLTQEQAVFRSGNSNGVRRPPSDQGADPGFGGRNQPFPDRGSGDTILDKLHRAAKKFSRFTGTLVSRILRLLGLGG